MLQTLPRPLRTLGRNVVALLANTVLNQGSLAALSLALNLYLAQIGYREDFIGLVSFVSVAAVAACAVPAGMLSNRVGPRACMIASGVVMGISFALTAVTTDPAVILISGAFSGVGQALVFVPSAPFLMESAAPEHRMRVWSLMFATMGVGSVIGSAGAGYLPGILLTTGLAGDNPVMPLRLTLLAGSVVVLLSAVPMLFARRGTSRGASSVSATPEQATDPRTVRGIIVRNSIAVVLIALATGAIFPFFNVYYVEQLGMSVSEVGLVFALGSLLMVPGTMLGPALGRRVGVVRGIALGRAAAVPLFVVLALAPSIGVGIGAFLVRAAFISTTWPLDNGFAMDLVGSRARALLAGTRSASWNLGWSVASLIAGQAIVATGYWVVFLASAVLMTAGLLFHYVAFIGHEPARASG